MVDQATTLMQPFRRNLDVAPVIIPVGASPIATPVASMVGKAVTTFKMHNPTPFWVWFRGWAGVMVDMPTVKEQGHYIAPGAVDICRTQMPQFIAAQAVAEPDLPLPTTVDADGALLVNGVRCRLVMIYGSGA